MVNSVIAAVTQDQNARPPVEETDFKLPFVIPPYPGIRPTQPPPSDYEYFITKEK